MRDNPNIYFTKAKNYAGTLKDFKLGVPSQATEIENLAEFIDTL